MEVNETIRHTADTASLARPMPFPGPDVRLGHADVEFWRTYLRRLAVVYPVAAILQEYQTDNQDTPSNAPAWRVEGNSQL